MTMTFKTNLLFACAGMAAFCVSQPASAQYYYAQGYSQPYVYPYVVVQPQPYAQQAARPYPYIIQRPQAYAPPPARRSKARRKVEVAKVPSRAEADDAPRSGPHEIHRTVSKTDPALIEELRRKTGKKIDKVVVVREKPVIIERKRYVDDPVRIVRRHKVVDVNVPAPPRDRGDEVGRVIHAEAEVTILGPDRMSIRLYRKGLDANAKAVKAD
ncbi:MAG: hypothetical protein AB7T86_09595 [Xanthobacteraceae bacterium]|uniref:hypothetical protein n=1 Tax=Pseudolabrys sp. TaxID=1960880 RepID=UPI003D13AE16